MGFSLETAEKAFYRQNGRCGHCGKKLTWANTTPGERGAWHPHHRKAVVHGGTDFLGNCVLLCRSQSKHCHLNIGHAGDWKKNVILHDKDLPYLYAGYNQY
jgi:hypothetical protein